MMQIRNPNSPKKMSYWEIQLDKGQHHLVFSPSPSFFLSKVKSCIIIGSSSGGLAGHRLTWNVGHRRLNEKLFLVADHWIDAISRYCYQNLELRSSIYLEVIQSHLFFSLFPSIQHMECQIVKSQTDICPLHQAL